MDFWYRARWVRVLGACALAGAALFAAPTLAPAGWRAAPVVPKLGAKVRVHAAAVLRAGAERGNRDDVFAKVGDSITESGSFLQDLACQKPSWGEWRRLRKTVKRFGRRRFPATYTSVWCGVADSFSRASLSAGSGWTAADAIGPLADAPHGCELALAHPLDCELARLRPGFALIMYGTNDLAVGSISRFRRSLSRVVTRTERAGTLAILSTIPVRTDYPSLTPKVPVFNAEIAALARARSVPLWNYWLQMTRDAAGLGLAFDGLHPSLLCPPCNSLDFTADGLNWGYNQRNLGALRVLDRLRRSLLAHRFR